MLGLIKIALWEVRRTKSGVDPRATALSLLLIAAIAAAGWSTSQFGFHTGDKLYTVTVDEEHLAEIIRTNPKFDVTTAGDNATKRFDLLIKRGVVTYQGNERSIAALDALDRTIREYDEERLIAKNDIPNAFPVWITINYLPRIQSFNLPTTLPHEDETSDSEDIYIIVPQEEDEERRATPPTPQPIVPTKETSRGRNIFQFDSQNIATPSKIEPPLPFRSVVLTFFFIFPIHFIAQFYSASIMNERVRKSGSLLLTTPIRASEIVLGKMLPYLAITLLFTILIGVAVGGNHRIVPLLLPVILTFLSTSFLAAVLARSFKELTFLLVFLSVSLSGYLFLPTIFVNVHGVSTISPMSLVVELIEGEKIRLAEYLFATLPLYLVSLLVFTFGIFIYRDEDLFSQKSIPSKLIDSIEVFLTRLNEGYFSVFSLSALLIPIAFIFQLIAIVLLFNLPIETSIVLFVIVAALIEEGLKPLGIYTILKRKPETSFRRSAMLGAASGLGFFVGEKLIVLIVLVSIADSIYGTAMGIGLLIPPLILHTTTTTTSALLTRRAGVKFYPLAVAIAATIHITYNLYLLRGAINV